MSIQTIQPATGEVLETFEPYSSTQVNEILDEARNAFVRWRETTFAERGAVLRRVAPICASRRQNWPPSRHWRWANPSSKRRLKLKNARGTATSTPTMPKNSSPMNRLPPTHRELCRVSTAGRRSGLDALELPLLAGLPLRRTRTDGGQYGSPETCLQCLALCVKNRAHLHESGLPHGAFAPCWCLALRRAHLSLTNASQLSL